MSVKRIRINYASKRPIGKCMCVCAPNGRIVYEREPPRISYRGVQPQPRKREKGGERT